MSDTRDKFDRASATWDEEPRRVKLAEELAAVIAAEVRLGPDMDVLDYGCGTGLVTLLLKPSVRSITGADTSGGMLEVLREKCRKQGLTNVRTALLQPGSGVASQGRFHLVVSCMTLHHVADVATLLRDFRTVLLPGGIVAVADLDKEDGGFHGDAIPAAHAGFGREEMAGMLEDAGFGDVRAITAAVIEKVSAGGCAREYSVFLITARTR